MIYHNEPMAEYQRRPAVSAGFCWNIVDECAAYAWYHSPLNPNPPPPKKPTEYFDVGEVTHLMLLEEKELGDRVVVIDEKDFRTNRAKDLRDMARFNGKTPLLAKNYELVIAMREAIWQSDAAEYFFSEGESEVSYTWELIFDLGLTITSIPCKARADRVTPGAIVDLKTANSASPAAFQAAIGRHGHHLRAAWYLDGWAAASPDPATWRKEYLFVVVAKDPPHLVSTFRLEPRAIEWGRLLYRKALTEYCQCVSTGQWLGYAGGEKIQNINLRTSTEYMLAELEANGKI